MHRRLTVAFVIVTLALCVAGYALRSMILLGTLRSEESDAVHQQTSAAAVAVRTRLDAGQVVTTSFLATLRADDQLLRLHLRDGSADRISRGADFVGGVDPSRSDDVWGAAEVPGGYVMLSEAEPRFGTALFQGVWSFVLLFLVFPVLAGLVGYLVSRALAAPFRQLARAAGALGRGRFDLDLPSSRIPEVRAIAGALQTSASQLEDRIAQEQSFAEHASHVLRTPLTSLRLELEELGQSGDVPDDVRDAVDRCVARIESLDVVAGELVELARRSSLASGPAIPLSGLAGACAQRWADELAHHDRALTSSVEGESETTYTPGPLEHLHELLLLDVLHRSRGDVRLVYRAASEGTLEICLTADQSARTRGRSRPPGSTFLRARAVVTALGGRVEGDQLDEGVALVLPRR
ncbi:MAG: HAMP domain-containing protein [Nocardioides sp.]|uniref:histidine kinase dimerization/phospho-acceptor domain-containing protein n=1 Tax=Nocardioides sp. TaxID=35761 RepID=UPI0039E36419